jgi:hypothetical protein
MPTTIEQLIVATDALAKAFGDEIQLRGFKPGGVPGQVPVKGEGEFQWEWGGLSATWGSVGGSILDQVDLQTALANRVPITRTINGQSLSSNITLVTDLSSGPVTSTGGVSAIADGALTIGMVNGLSGALAGKQATLVSGTNIKTVNGTSLLGSGDISVTGSSGVIDITASPYSAVGDGRRVDDAAISSGGTTLTSATANFQTSHVGKFIRVVGAGAAGADLVTTIASRTNTTTVVLTASASTMVSGATAFWGTNSTAAIQAAIDAAATSATTRTVLIPPGVFLCNVLLKPGIIIEGVNPRLNQSDLPSGSSIASSYSGVSILMPALRTAPVIDATGSNDATSCGGCVLRRFAVFGSPAKTGHGIRLGLDDGSVSFFAGQCIKVEQVWVSGFKYCFAGSRLADIHFELCQASSGVYGWNMAEIDSIETLRYTDGITITSCTSVGVETVFRFQGSKNVVINCGDYNSSGGTNNMLRLVDMKNSNVCITSANAEATGSDVIRKTDGRLVISSIKVLNGLKGLVAEIGTSANTAIHSAEVNGETWGAASATGIIWKGIAGNPSPLMLPKGYAMTWYSDNTLATLQDAELTSLRYGRQLDIMNTQDFFLRNATSAPYGSIGWSSTNISGTFLGRVDSASATFEWYSSGGPTANLAGRLSFEREVIALNENFEIRFVLADANAASGASICRYGVYSHDASITPLDGVGFRVDRSASTNIFFEVINNGSITSVDMGVAASTTMNSLREFIIRRTPQGIYGVIRNNPSSGSGITAAIQRNSGTLRAEYAAPAFYWGTTATAGYVTARIREFSFRRFVTNSFL